MTKILPVLILTFILIAGCTLQQTSHIVNFHFIDSNDTPLAHAQVKVTDNSQGFLQNYTDDNGNVSFQLIESVKYTIMVSNPQNGQTQSLVVYPTDPEYTVHLVPVPITTVPTPKTTPTLYNVQSLNEDINTVSNGITNTFQFITKFI